MRNLIKISQDCGLHYTSDDVVTNYSAHVSKDVVSADGVGLDIPPDDIDDIFWVTDNVSDWFLNKADFSGYFDEFDDKGNLIINVDHQEIASTVKGDINTNEAPALKKPAVQKLHKLEDQQLIRRNKITEDTLHVDHHEIASTVKGDINTNEAPALKKPAVQKLRKLEDQQLIRRNKITEDTLHVDHQEIASTVKGDINTNEAPALKKPAVQKLRKLEDQQLIRRNKITEDTLHVDHHGIASTVKGHINTNEAPALKKPAVQKLRKLEDQQLIRRNKIAEDTLPLDEAVMERKLEDTKRKIHQAYEDKAKKQRKVKVIEFIPPPPSNSKPQLHPHPKKARTILHRKKNKDLLFTCSQFRKNDSLSRPKKIRITD